MKTLMKILVFPFVAISLATRWALLLSGLLLASAGYALIALASGKNDADMIMRRFGEQTNK